MPFDWILGTLCKKCTSAPVEAFHAKSLVKICVRVALLVLEFEIEDTINLEN